MRRFSRSISICLATIGACVFGACSFGYAHFLYFSFLFSLGENSPKDCAIIEAEGTQKNLFQHFSHLGALSPMQFVIILVEHN